MQHRSTYSIQDRGPEISPCFPHISHHSYLSSGTAENCTMWSRPKKDTWALLHPVPTVKLPQAAKSGYSNKPQELQRVSKIQIWFYFFIYTRQKKQKQDNLKSKTKEIDFWLRRGKNSNKKIYIRYRYQTIIPKKTHNDPTKRCVKPEWFLKTDDG